eukprot:2212628-Pleurochrysis_carterae.AAC.1
MERYVDVAYQRDGEEPKRWAFKSLCERGEAGQLSPLADGTFYPASQFRLPSRSALPFPPYLHISRNHFNLDWLGERRLKNAVMVLEWTPSAAAVAAAPAETSSLTEEQRQRLHKALVLLDVTSAGGFARSELREALRCAEDLTPTDGELDALLAENGGGGGGDGDGGGDGRLSFAQMAHVFTCG